VDKAEEDFSSADVLLHAGEVPISSPACFHCQQCAEKYLKAYLQEHALEFARNHELLPLLELSITLDPEFKELKRDLESLNRYAVATRYPGLTIKVETAEAALASTKRIRKFVRRKLKIK
jgi:HEPN domain-containing protein